MPVLPVLVVAMVLMGGSPAAATGSPEPAVDGFDPIGIVREPALRAGEWRLSYRYERVRFEGYRDGTKRLTVGDVRDDGYLVIPTSLTVQAHRFSAMFAPFDRLTLSASLPYLNHQMEHMGPGANGATLETRGVGDLMIDGTVPFIRRGTQSLDVSLGLSMPTGSIQRGSYPMRLGTGTWDLVPGASYRGRSGAASWGLQWTGVFRLRENDQNYSVGDQWEVTGWLAWRWADWLSSSLRLAWNESHDIEGADPELAPALSPAMNPRAQGGSRLDLGPGINVALPRLGRQNLAFEATWPVYQSLNGPQLEEDWRLMAGWRWAF